MKIADAHKGKISGVCWSPSEEDRLLSCGSDMSVKIWDTANRTEGSGDVNMEAGPSQVCSIAVPSKKKKIAELLYKETKTGRCVQREICIQVRLKSFPIAVLLNHICSSIDHHRHDPIFATASSVLQVWDETKCVDYLSRCYTLILTLM